MVELSANEWEMLKQLVQLLEPANASIRDMCNDNSHLGLQIAISRMLLKEVNEAVVPELHNEKNFLVANIESMFQMLEYEKNYGLALFVDPRFKDRCFKDSCEFRRGVKQWLSSEYQPIEEALVVETGIDESVMEQPAIKKPKSLFARQVNISQKENTPRPTTTWQHNLEFKIVSYNAEKPVPLESNPLVYWQKNVVRFLILSKTSPKFLSPSTSHSSKQLFSHARDVFHYKRSQLNPYNAEQLVFLNRALIDVNFTY